MPTLAVGMLFYGIASHVTPGRRIHVVFGGASSGVPEDQPRSSTH